MGVGVLESSQILAHHAAEAEKQQQEQLLQQ